jgi:anti-sigma-K factor RskA
MADINPELLEQIAAAYVLGTLTGPERERCAQLMREHPELEQRVHAWENRLLPLATGVPPVAPSAPVWQAIEAHINPTKQPAPLKHNPARAGFGFWQGAASLVFGLVLGAAVVVWGKHSETLPESYVAVLAPTTAAKPVMHASALRKEATLFVKMIEPLEVETGKMLVLWALQKNTPPHRVGIVQPSGKSRIALDAPADTVFKNVTTLALSAERTDTATTTPSGEYLLQGPCVKLW